MQVLNPKDRHWGTAAGRFTLQVAFKIEVGVYNCMLLMEGSPGNRQPQSHLRRTAAHLAFAGVIFLAPQLYLDCTIPNTLLLGTLHSVIPAA